MKHQGATWILVILAAIFVLALGLYHVARPPGRSGEFKPVLPEGVQVALEGPTRITSSEKGRVAWIMTSNGLVFYRDKKVVEVGELTALIPLEDGGTVEVRGKSGTYFETTEDIELENGVTIVLDKAGKREWIMNGDTASYRHREKAFYMSAPRGTVYSGPGESADISGARARYDITARTMQLKKDVICKWSKGTTIETDKLNYSLDTQIASTDSRVLITGKGFTLRGLGLEADMAGKNVVIPHSVNIILDRGMEGVK